MAKRLLILGASGFIGGYLQESLARLSDISVVGTYHGHFVHGLEKLDLLDIVAIRHCLDAIRPDGVVFLSGTKDVTRCEREPSFAIELNVHTVQNYINACADLQIRPSTLYFSTDYVFGGFAGAYRPESEVGPRTVYGATNLLAERLLASSGIPGVLLRVSAVMGLRGGFYRWLSKGLSRNEPLDLYENTYFSPTSIGRLIKFVCRYVENLSNFQIAESMSISHLSDGYRFSRYEFGKIVAQKNNYSLDLLRPSVADIQGTSYQYDLSLLPDDRQEFRPLSEWDELEGIF